MAKKKKQVRLSNDDAALDPGDYEKTRREDERGRTVLNLVGKAIKAGTKLRLEWHPVKRLPIGDHRSHFSTYIGVVVRERVTITYKEWSEVSKGLLDELHDSIARGFFVIENRKGGILSKAAKRCKAFKTRLRVQWMYLEDGTIRQQPPWKYSWILKPDWDKFVDYSTSEEFKAIPQLVIHWFCLVAVVAQSRPNDDDEDDDEDDEDDEEQQMQIKDETETNLINLRRTIYLTIMSSVDFEEAGHKLLKIKLEPGQE
ncbi:hypothetical protein SOVF_005650, partial [Spinacia oleracea]